MERERLACFVGRLLNSSFSSVGCICWGARKGTYTEKINSQEVKSTKCVSSCSAAGPKHGVKSTLWGHNRQSCTQTPHFTGDFSCKLPLLLIDFHLFSNSSPYLLLSHHPVRLSEGCSAATGAPLCHVCSLAACLTLCLSSQSVQLQKITNNKKNKTCRLYWGHISSSKHSHWRFIELKAAGHHKEKI